MTIGYGMPHLGSGPEATNVTGPFHGIESVPTPDKSTIRMLRAASEGSATIQVRLYGVAYCPEVHTMKVADAVQTGIDGATTVAVSRAAYGYKGLKGGTWYNPFLWSDAQAQTLTNSIAKLNLEPRDVVKFATKHNPKYEPWDLLHVTYFSEYSATHWEVIGIEHRMNLDERGGGAETILTLRRWTA